MMVLFQNSMICKKIMACIGVTLLCAGVARIPTSVTAHKL